MISNASERHEVSDARTTVVKIAGWLDPDDGEVSAVVLADPSHVCGAQAQTKIRQSELVDGLAALTDPGALDPIDVTHYDAREPNDPPTIARIHVDTMAGAVDHIELNGDVLREDADPEDELKDETEVVRS